MIRITLSALLFIVMVFAIGCPNDNPTSPPESQFSGILRTDISGAILGGDTTDWKVVRTAIPTPKQKTDEVTSLAVPSLHNSPELSVISPAIAVVPVPTNTYLSAAYCNPGYYIVNFQLTLSAAGCLTLVTKSNPATIVHSFATNQALSAGVHLIRWDVSNITPGIYRVEMTADVGSYRYTEYGDVEIKHPVASPTARTFADAHFSESNYRNAEYLVATLAYNPTRIAPTPFVGTRADWNALPFLPNGIVTYSKYDYLGWAFFYDLPTTHNDQYYTTIGLNLAQFGFGWDDGTGNTPNYYNFDGTSANETSYHSYFSY